MDTVNLIVKTANCFYQQLKNDKNGRYRSWEHCYSEFYNARGKMVDDSYIDYLSLHLAFYLASWGMYRGSSFYSSKTIKCIFQLLKKY